MAPKKWRDRQCIRDLRIVGVQKIAANHDGHDAALTQFVEDLATKKLWIESRLVRDDADRRATGRKRRIPHDGIKITRWNDDILKTLIDMGGERIE